MSEKTFCVYKHICPLCTSTNGIYIGITCRDLDERWKADGKGYLKQRLNKDGKQVYSQPKIAYAILKYTWDTFSHEILEDGLSYELATQKEIEYIDYFDSYEHGLNSTRGGDGFLIYTTTEASLAAKKQNRKKYYQKVKADPVRYEKIRTVNTIAMKKFLANPEHYAKELRRTRENKRLKNSTPEGRAQSAERSRNRQHEIRDLRFKLKELFSEYPNKFSGEDKSCIFDFKPNDRKHYLCMSVTKFREILHRIELEIENDKRTSEN